MSQDSVLTSAASRKQVVLMVDDDPNNLAVIRDCLIDCDYTLLVAEDGESAIQRASYARPDLILLDVMMPGVDGYETCRLLKERVDTKDIPVIFMTALAETVHKVKGLEAGAVDYITKPFQREEMMARVAVHLKIRELTHRLQEANENLERKVEARTTDLSIANRVLEEEIAERQAAQEQLQEQAQLLEEKIEELQVAQDALLRSERQLRQSQKMEAIGTLAGGIAHDFNNILTAIIGNTDLAQRKLTDTADAARFLEQAQCASQRARELVSRILAFSRQGEQERKPVHLAGIVEEVLKLLRSSLPTTIEIRQHTGKLSNGDTVLADPTQLHQVLMNLGTNAAHAMRDRGGVLTVSLSDVAASPPQSGSLPCPAPASYLRLTVHDTGCGMDDSIRERIFDPYFTTKKVGEGTGMGLAVVHGIVKNHCGNITVASEPGKGSTFHVDFPAHAGSQEECVPEDVVQAGGTERILFVDDDEMLMELGREALQSLGYTVTVSGNGIEALRLFRSVPHAFDLVITDMTMPGLTGKELARELMAIRRDIRILICSGFSEDINEQRAREAGIREYLMKPYSPGSLDRAIRRALSGEL